MKQYGELKAQSDGALLLFRMGDFYELFGDDAVVASRILGITLTSRDKGKPDAMPMAGVPHHSIQGYIQKLLAAGKKVAIGEQVEEATAGKGIVRREIVRTFTPAVQFEAEQLEVFFLATALRSAEGFVLACLDASTGECRVSDVMDEEQLSEEFSSLPIRHCLNVGGSLPVPILESLQNQPRILLEDLPSNILSDEQASSLLKRHYGLAGLETFLPIAEGIRALGILVKYAASTQKIELLAHLQLPKALHASHSLRLGPQTARHLDLFPDSAATPSLYHLIPSPKTSLGARALRALISEPLASSHEILSRQASIRELGLDSSLLSRVQTQLTEIYDLERILGRVHTGLANPRDTLALGRSIAAIPGILHALSACTTPSLHGLLSALGSAHERLADLGKRILSIQRADAPLTSKDGGIFDRGTDSDLDRLIDLNENGERFLVQLEQRERERTGIASLKVRYNRVFGYYIEITKAHLANVPSDYQRKQTMVGAERFFTEELKRFEEEILSASTKQRALELRLFEALLEDIRNCTPALMSAAQSLGTLDAWISLARLQEFSGWVFPQIDDSMDVEIEQGRHPVVDQASGGRFVPNSLALDPLSRRLLVITGPNMGGKSTLMRQVALIVLLGQMGAPVPAARARWGAFSSIHTRIGAQDAIAKGQSTFMVEMSELAQILHSADQRSLVILDEIGRGTSTYDGMSVAWATLEWIAKQIGCRTLFATHYHELTVLDRELPGLANAHMAVESSKKRGEGIRFLYELKNGPASESFGIQVAQLAGLPKPLISRAWQVLEKLETAPSGTGVDLNQLSLFGQPPAEPMLTPEVPSYLRDLEARLSKLNPNEMTPLQALNALVSIRDSLNSAT